MIDDGRPGPPGPDGPFPIPGDGDDGLSLGAKVGISVSYIVGATVLALLLVLLTWAVRCRRASRPRGELVSVEDTPIPPEPELGETEGRELEASKWPRELTSDAAAPGTSGGQGRGGNKGLNPGGGGSAATTAAKALEANKTGAETPREDVGSRFLSSRGAIPTNPT